VANTCPCCKKRFTTLARKKFDGSIEKQMRIFNKDQKYDPTLEELEMIVNDENESVDEDDQFRDLEAEEVDDVELEELVIEEESKEHDEYYDMQYIDRLVDAEDITEVVLIEDNFDEMRDFIVSDNFVEYFSDHESFLDDEESEKQSYHRRRNDREKPLETSISTNRPRTRSSTRRENLTQDRDCIRAEDPIMCLHIIDDEEKIEHDEAEKEEENQSCEKSSRRKLSRKNHPFITLDDYLPPKEKEEHENNKRRKTREDNTKEETDDQRKEVRSNKQKKKQRQEKEESHAKKPREEQNANKERGDEKNPERVINNEKKTSKKKKRKKNRNEAEDKKHEEQNSGETNEKVKKQKKKQATGGIEGSREVYEEKKRKLKEEYEHALLKLEKEYGPLSSQNNSAAEKAETTVAKEHEAETAFEEKSKKRQRGCETPAKPEDEATQQQKQKKLKKAKDKRRTPLDKETDARPGDDEGAVQNVAAKKRKKRKKRGKKQTNSNPDLLPKH